MNKKQFLDEFDIHLKRTQASKQEREDILNYYQELIDDQLEEGYREEWIIEKLGTFEEIMNKLSLQPKDKAPSYKEKIRPYKNKMGAGFWVLIGCLFPLWIALAGVLIGIACGAFALLFSGGAVLLAFIVSGIASIAGGCIGLIASAFNFQDNFYSGLYALGSSLLAIGFGVVVFPLAMIAFKKYIYFISLTTKKIVYRFKR